MNALECYCCNTLKFRLRFLTDEFLEQSYASVIGLLNEGVLFMAKKSTGRLGGMPAPDFHRNRVYEGETESIFTGFIE